MCKKMIWSSVAHAVASLTGLLLDLIVINPKLRPPKAWANGDAPHGSGRRSHGSHGSHGQRLESHGRQPKPRHRHHSRHCWDGDCWDWHWVIEILDLRCWTKAPSIRDLHCLCGCVGEFLGAELHEEVQGSEHLRDRLRCRQHLGHQVRAGELKHHLSWGNMESLDFSKYIHKNQAHDDIHFGSWSGCSQIRKNPRAAAPRSAQSDIGHPPAARAGNRGDALGPETLKPGPSENDKNDKYKSLCQYNEQSAL